MNLDENVGCCVNGAGLAMATMDMVKYYDGESTDFLDVGGSPNPDKVVAAAGIITSDPNIRAILFDIFGGITRCDDVAKGMVRGHPPDPDRAARDHPSHRDEIRQARKVSGIREGPLEGPSPSRGMGRNNGRFSPHLFGAGREARNLTEDGP